MSKFAQHMYQNTQPAPQKWFVVLLFLLKEMPRTEHTLGRKISSKHLRILSEAHLFSPCFGGMFLSVSGGIDKRDGSLVVSFHRQNNSGLYELQTFLCWAGKLVKTPPDSLFTWGQANQPLHWSRSQLLKLLQEDPCEIANHHCWNIVLLHLLHVFAFLSPTQHTTLP